MRSKESTINYPNGDQYIGEVKSGKPHGKGIMKKKIPKTFTTVSHRGNWVNSKKEGPGIETEIDYVDFQSGVTIGKWKNDTIDGPGIFILKDKNGKCYKTQHFVAHCGAQFYY